MAKKTNVPLKRRRRSELNVKLIAIIAAVLFVVTIGIVFAVIGSHKKENNPSVADNQNNETTAEPTTEEETTTKVPTVEVDLMMIGDMLMHEGVVKSGLMDDGTYNFDHLYTNIAKDISSADIKSLIRKQSSEVLILLTQDIQHLTHHGHLVMQKLKQDSILSFMLPTTH